MQNKEENKDYLDVAKQTIKEVPASSVTALYALALATIALCDRLDRVMTDSDLRVNAVVEDLV